MLPVGAVLFLLSYLTAGFVIQNVATPPFLAYLKLLSL